MDDVWLHVFSYFPPRDLLQLEAVSMNWKELVAEVFRKRRAIDLEEDFPGCVAEPESMRSLVERHSPALADIQIRVKPKTERFMVSPSEHHLTRRVVRQINRTATRISRLRVERMNLTIGAVEELALLPESLREISIVNCSLSCDNMQICQIAQNSFRTLFQRCSQLRKFEIAWRGYCFEHFELTDELMSHLPDSVEELNISAGNSLKITSLDFLERKRVMSFTLQRSFISAQDLNSFIPMAASLQSLDLTSSINILDVSAIGRLSHLRHLWLGNMREGVNDMGLLSVLSGCPLLESLCIENLPQLTEKSLCHLGSLKKLKRLEAGGISRFNESCCSALRRCSQLEHLDVKFCRNITIDGLRHLFSIATLRHLDIIGIAAFKPSLLAEFSTVPAKLICDNYSPSCLLVFPHIPAPA